MVASNKLRARSRKTRDVNRDRCAGFNPRASRLAPRAFRRAVSLLEVLISMFVLLFGLMGVAAIFPVGNHYASKSEQLDRGSGLAEAALSELKTRAFLQPRLWIDVVNAKLMINPGTGSFELPAETGHAFVLDPVGAAETGASVGGYFPYDANTVASNANPWNSGTLALPGNKWPIRRVTIPQNMYGPPNNLKLTPRLADAAFRLQDDLSITMPEEDDRPGMQRWVTLDVDPVSGNANSPATPNDATDDTALARAYAGSYSWFATVLPTSYAALQGMQPSDQRYGSFQYEVSVAVVHKRDGAPAEDTERELRGELKLGGDLILYDQANDFDAVDAAAQDIRAGQWVLIAGQHPGNGKFLLKWYRLLAFDDETTELPIASDNNNQYAGRRAMLENVETDDPFLIDPMSPNTYRGLRVILMPGVIGVATQTLELVTD